MHILIVASHFYQWSNPWIKVLGSHGAYNIRMETDAYVCASSDLQPRATYHMQDKLSITLNI